MYMGPMAQSNYTITDPDVNGVITLSGASGSVYAVKNLEFIRFSQNTVQRSVPPPIAIGASPANAAINVNIASNIVVTFSETVQRGTGSIVLKDAAGTIIETFDAALSTCLSISGATLTINPTSDLVGNTNYFVTFEPGTIKDITGYAYAGSTTYHFTTATPPDTIAPVAPKLVTNAAFNFLIDPQVTMQVSQGQTSLGSVVFDLNPEQAPITVANMLAYANSGFYNNTLFHRVIPGFMVQGGGFTTGLAYKTPTYSPIVLESNNGLSNLRGTIAMARTNVADSATTQFFVNQVDNTFLNYSPASPGYAVFGTVVSGLSVIDSIANVPLITPPVTTPLTTPSEPVTDVTITSLQQTLAGSSITNAATFTVSDLEAGARWSFSLDGGATWIAGTGNSFAVPVGNYAASAIEVRQTDAAGNVSTAGVLTSSLVVETTAPTVTTFSPASAAASADIACNIVVTFSEAVQRGTGNIVLKNAAGTAIETFNAATSNLLSISDTTLTINPTSNLASGTKYFVTFAPGTIKDLAGNAYAGTTVYNFTTQASPITGTAGNDILTGTALPEMLDGLAGDDTLNGGAGADTLIGGSGNDTYIVDNVGDAVTENPGEGTDLIKVNIATAGSSYTLGDNIENGTLINAVAYNLTGNALDNVLTGNAAINILTGGDGNDTLNGGVGADTLIGGTGNDTYVVDNVGDVITENLGEGTDTALSSITYTLAANVDNLTLTGTAAINGTGNTLDNVITGNAAANTLNGNGGADTLIGGDGNDTYMVDSIDDTVTETNALAAGGTDLVQSSVDWTLGANVEKLTLKMGAGNLNGTGNGLANVITGNDGNNTLDGGDGVDILIGGTGNDTYIVDLKITGTGAAAAASLQDSITEVASGGTDTLQLRSGATLTTASTLTLATGLENLDASGTGTMLLNLTGNASPNILTGNDANNILNGGAGIDTYAGGLGNDTYVLDQEAELANVTENLNAGTDLLQITYANASTSAAKVVDLNLGNLTEVENVTVTGTGLFNLTGNALDNMLTGNAAINILTGGDGNDTLNGGPGADTLIGGTGNDTYVVDNVGDVITENLGEGTDTALSSITYTLTANVDNLTLTGTAAINGTGNALDNIITGNAAANTLNGNGGADTLIGGDGNDTYMVDSIDDTVTETNALAAGGTDLVQSSVDWTLGANVEKLTLKMGAGNLNGTGNGLANVITGNDGNNTLDGGDGVDTLIGGTGNDTYIVDLKITGTGAAAAASLQDSITEVASVAGGTDTLQLRSSATLTTASTLTLATALENLDASGTGTMLLNLTGNISSNILTGNDANNILNGGAGTDTLIGGAGADTFVLNRVASMVAAISDFNTAEGDRIGLTSNAYGNLFDNTGALNAGVFTTGTQATTAQQRLLYDALSGALRYDSDGNGALASVQIATLTNNSALTANAFMLVAGN